MSKYREIGTVLQGKRVDKFSKSDEAGDNLLLSYVRDNPFATGTAGRHRSQKLECGSVEVLSKLQT